MAVQTVVMECRIRVCGSRKRIQRFTDRASEIAVGKFPSTVRCSISVDDCDSTLLRHQWHRENDVDTYGVPVGRELGFAFADPTGRLTAAKLESLSLDILSELQPDPFETESPAAELSEQVPWILTLETEVDRTAQRDIATRHPMLELRVAPLFATS
ncbi:hypothetical protein [Gordonia paraffinivorans]|uniref:hypothetical protein n=1 Tax=Gordonia paraffinivorans TaxID=175628 RepID=UPI0020D11F18|nr:hypothetical protein [Gordonia paraffinivorans]